MLGLEDVSRERCTCHVKAVMCAVRVARFNTKRLGSKWRRTRSMSTEEPKPENPGPTHYPSHHLRFSLESRLPFFQIGNHQARARKPLVVTFGGAYHGWWDGMQPVAGNELRPSQKAFAHGYMSSQIWKHAC